MSARHHRRKRWEQWNTRPAVRALASRSRRERFTEQQLADAADVGMTVGEMAGRRLGERDLIEFLAQDFVLRPDAEPQDHLELAAYVGGKALANEADDFLRVEQARLDRELVERAQAADPESVHRLACILDDDSLTGEQRKNALEAFARELGVFPESGDLLDGDEDRAVWASVEPADDLLDVAEAAGVTPEAQAEWDRWWREATADGVIDLDAERRRRRGEG